MRILIAIATITFAACTGSARSAIANDCDTYGKYGWDKNRATVCISQAMKSENPRDLFLASHALRSLIIYDNFDDWNALYYQNIVNSRLAQLDLDSARAAINLLEWSANLGHVEAQYELGRVLSGEGINYYNKNRTGPAHLSSLLDFERALQWFRKAAARGYAPAQVEAAVLIFELHAKGSLDEALRYVSGAAKQGHPFAARQFARFFREFSDDKTADVVSEAWRLYALDLSRDESRRNASSGTTVSGPLLEQMLALEEQIWQAVRNFKKRSPFSANEIALARTLAQELRRAEFDDWGLPLSVKAALRLRDRAEKEFKAGRKMLVM